MCHGGPGVSRAPWVRGLTPTPPFLMDAAYRWTPAQLGYILEHGVKMSAMPAWGAVRTPAEIWELVAFLEALPDLSPSDFQRLADTPVRKPGARDRPSVRPPAPIRVMTLTASDRPSAWSTFEAGSPSKGDGRCGNRV